MTCWLLYADMKRALPRGGKGRGNPMAVDRNAVTRNICLKEMNAQKAIKTQLNT